MAGISVADIIGSIQLQNNSIEENESAISNAYDEIKSTNQTIAENHKQGALDAATVESVKQSGILNKQAQDAEAKRLLGTDMNSAANIIGQLAPQIMADFAKAEALDKQISAKESVGFFDNPFEYIGNQLTLEKDYSDYNAAARSVNRKSAFIKDMENLTQEQVQTNLATLETTSKVAAAAATRNAALAQTDAANNALINAQTADVNKITTLKNMDQQQLSNKINAMQLQNEAENMEMRRKEFAASQQERSIRLKELQLKLQENTANEQEKAQNLAILNAGRKVLGQSTFSSVKDAQFYFKTKEGNANFQKIYDVGYQAIDAAKGSGKDIVIDTSPATAADLLVSSRGKLDPAQSKVQALITDVYTGISTGSIKIPGLDTTKKANIIGQADANIRSAATAMASNVSKDTASNIYAPPPLQAVLAAHPALASNPLMQKVFAVEVKSTDAREIDPQYFMSRTVEAIANKEVTYKEAVKGLQGIFQAAMETNNATKGYTRVGLPEQTTFNAQIKADPNAIYFSDNKTTDLSNEVKISGMVNRMLAHKLVNKRMSPLTTDTDLSNIQGVK